MRQVLAATLAAAIVACSGIEALPEDQPCNVGISIAQRTMKLHQQREALARERADAAFDERYSCIDVDVAKDDVGNLYHCSSMVGGMTCGEVRRRPGTI